MANDRQLDAEIVIKEVQKTTLASAPSFFEEARALYASAHPNVVQIHYACEDLTRSISGCRTIDEGRLEC